MVLGPMGVTAFFLACSTTPGEAGGGGGAGRSDGGSVSCTDDEGCHSPSRLGHVCEEGRCVPGCARQQDCTERKGEGWICRSMHCVRIADLDSGSGEEPDAGPADQGPPVIPCDPPCRENQRCHRGLCVDRCQAPLDCPADVRIRLAGYSIDAYEASRTDATADEPGCNGTRACSAPGRLPWTSISWPKASEACAAAGKRLCTAVEWRNACSGQQGLRFPYGNTAEPAACNGASADGWDGIWPTGSSDRCVTAQGAFDLAGNVQEWLGDDMGATGRGTLGGSFMSNSSQLACDYTHSLEAETYRWEGLGFRCCRGD